MTIIEDTKIKIDFIKKTIELKEGGWTISIKDIFEDITPLRRGAGNHYGSDEVGSKLKIFMETFNLLSKSEDKDVEESNLFSELISKGKFSLDDCKNILNKAMQNGHLYERRSGWLAKA